jgi:hypothetical protein
MTQRQDSQGMTVDMESTGRDKTEIDMRDSAGQKSTLSRRTATNKDIKPPEDNRGGA